MPKKSNKQSKADRKIIYIIAPARTAGRHWLFGKNDVQGYNINMINEASLESLQNDIAEINLVLKKHENRQKLSDLELKDAELRINRIISWAQSVSKTLDIPIQIK